MGPMMLQNVIPGMPVCGKCPNCGGAMHFHTEVVSGLCRFCGPGSSRYNPHDKTGLSLMEKQAALTTSANEAAAKAKANGAMHGSAPQQLPPKAPEAPITSGPLAAMQQLNTSSEGTMDALLAGEIEAPGPAGSVATADPAVVMAHIQAKGFDKDACAYCVLAQNGMNVSAEVVPHAPECPNK